MVLMEGMTVSQEPSYTSRFFCSLQFKTFFAGIPRDVDFNAVLETFMKIDGVVRVHNLRIWALSLEKTALSAHLAIRK